MKRISFLFAFTCIMSICSGSFKCNFSGFTYTFTILKNESVLYHQTLYSSPWSPPSDTLTIDTITVENSDHLVFKVFVESKYLPPNRPDYESAELQLINDTAYSAIYSGCDWYSALANYAVLQPEEFLRIKLNPFGQRSVVIRDASKTLATSVISLPEPERIFSF